MANRVSQNGWPADNPARRSRQVPGSEVRLTVAEGPAGDVLMYLAMQFDQRVEDIDLRSSRGEYDDWGHADRDVRGGGAVSNHASATAIDLNATRHPLGARGTFTREQVAEIHQILAELDHVVRWGGDYTGRVDEMHFEINATAPRVAAVAARLGARAPQGGVAMTPNEFFMAGVWHTYRDPAEAKAVGLPAPGGVQEMVEKHTFAEWFTSFCVRQGQILAEQRKQTGLLTEIRDLLAADRKA